MAQHLKKLDEQVVVITGASAGIGLATARLAAERGARLVLAARNGEALNQLVDEIRGGGGEAIAVVADVGNEEEVRGIARAAVERFGGFDTWINNAATSIYGRMIDVTTEDHRRLFETNFWGVVYGSLEAARHFREQGRTHAGALINIGSAVSDRAIPIQGMYSASKHAIKGFTDALRMELEEEGVPVSVTLIKPGSIDTPFPQHARNYMDEEPTLPPPVYSPGRGRRAILHCAESPEREVTVGGGGKSIAAMTMAPRIADKVMQATLTKAQKKGEPPRNPAGALHAPIGHGAAGAGRLSRHVLKSSASTRRRRSTRCGPACWPWGPGWRSPPWSSGPPSNGRRR